MKPVHVALTIAAVLVSALPASPQAIAADVPAPPGPTCCAAASPAVPLAFAPLPPGRVVPRGWPRDGAYAVVAVPAEIAPGATVRLTFEAGDVPANIDVVDVQRSTSPTMKDLGKRVRLLFDGYMRDPSICRGPGGTYYLTGTTEGQRCIRLWESKDLREWRRLDFEWTYGGSPWHESYKKASRPLWAPEVHYLKGTFWLTYSMPTYTGEFKDSGSGLLRSTTGRPEGPYVDVSPDERLGDEIDASLFEDDDGAVYFVWHCGKIRRMKADMSGPAEPGRKLRLSVPDPDPRHHSELCAKIHGPGSFDHIGYEGVFLFKVGDTYFLTGADRCDGKYTSWVATSKSLYGPYGPRYPAIPDGGHNAYFRDAEGKWWSTIFNGPISEKPGILPIDISPDGQIGLRDG